MKERLHLVADDLTGALDSAAAFASPEASIAVSWSLAAPPDSGSFAFSTETRDAARDVAVERSGLAAAAVGSMAQSLVFKKIDSLLRGHVAAELTSFARHLRPDRIVLAPAHPALGRVTRGAIQMACVSDGTPEPVAVDLAAQLAACGFGGDQDLEGRPPLVFADANSEADLAAIVVRERARGGRVLWCGSGGLAQALAGRRRTLLPVPTGRTLLVIGTDHRVAATQIEAIRRLDADAVIAWRETESPSEVGERLSRRLATGRLAVLAPAIAPRPRDEAARMIAAMLTPLLQALPSPDALFCSGGETLRVVCDALGADGLQCEGFVAEGIPLSRLRGGRWPSLAITSKSGAFGEPGTLANLFLPALGRAAFT